MPRGKPERHVGSAYEALVDARESRRCRGSLMATNAAPREPMALAEYFAGLPVERLRECWVGAIVGALDELYERGDGRPAGLARPLLVVAERLTRGNTGGLPPADGDSSGCGAERDGGGA